MFVDRPGNPNGLYLITDARFRYDRDLQAEQGGQPVLREWSFGKAALGKENWTRVTRVALYDYGEDTEALSDEQAERVQQAGVTKRKKLAAKFVAENRAAKRGELVQLLNAERPKLALILQTRSAEKTSKDEFGDAKGLLGTMAWQAIEPADSLAEMAGTVYFPPPGSIITCPVMGVLNPVNYEHVHGEAVRRSLRGALAYAQDKPCLLLPDPLRTGSNGELELLGYILQSACRGTPIAVDIESYSVEHLITAIGLSDGVTSVSVPWEPFTPYGTNQIEPGATEHQKILVATILATSCPKILHNYTYDIPFLESKGLEVEGEIHDTMAMHAVAYRQYRHGLQRACAVELLIPPWKSIWHPKDPPKGITKEDPEWWTLYPADLRSYNAKDAFYTWHLGRALSWKLGLGDLYEPTLANDDLPRRPGPGALPSAA